MAMAAALMMKKALLLEAKKIKIPWAIAFFSLLTIQEHHPK
jgi:hypothetical protein